MPVAMQVRTECKVGQLFANGTWRSCLTMRARKHWRVSVLQPQQSSSVPRALHDLTEKLGAHCAVNAGVSGAVSGAVNTDVSGAASGAVSGAVSGAEGGAVNNDVSGAVSGGAHFMSKFSDLVDVFVDQRQHHFLARRGQHQSVSYIIDVLPSHSLSRLSQAAASCQ